MQSVATRAAGAKASGKEKLEFQRLAVEAVCASMKFATRQRTFP